MNVQLSGQREPVSIEVTEGALEALRKTRGWVLFLGIVSIVIACFAGIGLLIGAITLAVKELAGLALIIETVVILVVTILYAIYWLRYSNSLQRIENPEGSLEEILNDTLVRQHRLWTFQGILFIVVIALILIAAVGGLFLAGQFHQAVIMTSM